MKQTLANTFLNEHGDLNEFSWGVILIIWGVLFFWISYDGFKFYRKNKKTDFFNPDTYIKSIGMMFFAIIIVIGGVFAIIRYFTGWDPFAN